MKLLSSIALTVLLIGCQTPEVSPETIEEPVAQQSSSEPAGISSYMEPVLEPQPIEPYPSELSIQHFSDMKLTGTGLMLEAVLAQNSSYTRHKISYESNGVRISGIMNIPNGDGPYPLVVLNHGYIDPAIYTVGRGLKREQDYLARQGFAVLHTDYRGHGESDPNPDVRNIYDASLGYSIDSINAINAVKNSTLTSVDTSKVGMMGHSMGGGVTLNVAAAHPAMIDAAVLYAPVHARAWDNFVRWRSDGSEGDPTREAMGTFDTDPNNWNMLSASAYLQNSDDPFLIFHGTNDASVPIEWSDYLHKRLQDLQKESEYIIYNNERHEFGPKWNDFMQKTSSFFSEKLKS